MEEGAGAGAYDGFYSPEELVALRRADATLGVDAEIEAARVIVMRLLESGQAAERPELLLRAVESVVRATRVQHQIGKGGARTLLDAADRILAELGMGGEG